MRRYLPWDGEVFSITTVMIIGAVVMAIAAAVFTAKVYQQKKQNRRPQPNYERYGLKNPKYDRFR